MLYEPPDKVTSLNYISGGEIVSLPNLESFRSKEIAEPIKAEIKQVVNPQRPPSQPSPKVHPKNPSHVQGEAVSGGENPTNSIIKRLTPLLQKERHTPLLAKSPGKCSSTGHTRKKSSLLQNDENDNHSNKVQTPLCANSKRLLQTFDGRPIENHSKSYSSKSKSIELFKNPQNHNRISHQVSRRITAQNSHVVQDCSQVSNYRSLEQIPSIPNEASVVTKPKSTHSLKIRPVEKSSFKSVEMVRKPSINQERPKSHKLQVSSSTREPCFQRSISKSIARFEPRPTNFVASLIYKNTGNAERREPSQKNGASNDPFWQIFRALKNARSETKALSKPRHRDQFKAGQSLLKVKLK